MVRIFLLVCIVLTFCVSFADSNRKLAGKRLEVPPTVDGKVDISEWKDAAHTGGFVAIESGRETEFKTEFYAGFDDAAMYFGFIMHDPDPTLIRALEYRRNGSISGDDVIQIAINPFGTFRGEDFNMFFINPRGATRAQFAGGRAAKREWEGEWIAQAQITDRGWEAEVVIPFKILRLPSAGTRSFTINAARVVARTQQNTIWSNIGLNEDIRRVGIWEDIIVPANKEPQAIQLLPYTIGGYDKESKEETEFGIDFRHQFGSKMTGLATINPDFKNIEGDVLGIEFSRFERLAEERRPFFREGADFYQYGGMSARMFAPQRIRQIDFGAKVFGKMTDSLSFGVLHTEKFSEESASVVRFRETWDSGSSINLGYSRRHTSSFRNDGVGLDASYKTGNWNISTNLGHTIDSIVGKGHRIDFDFSHNSGGFRNSIGWQEITSKFLPRLGFAPRTGYRGWSVFNTYEREFISGNVSNVSVMLSWQDRKNIETGELYYRSFFNLVEANLRNGVGLEISYSDSNFKGIKDQVANIEVSYPHNNPFDNFGISYSFGKIGDSDYKLISVRGQYRFASVLSVGALLQFSMLGDEKETQNILNIAYELSEFRSLLGRAVIKDGKLNWYLAFKQSGNFGAEYYLIIGNPNADRFSERFVLKVVYPLEVVRKN